MKRKELLTVIEERIQILTQCAFGDMFFHDGKLQGTEDELQRERVRIAYRVEELRDLKDVLIKQQLGLLSLPPVKRKDLPSLACYAIEKRLTELRSFLRGYAIDPPDKHIALERRDFCEREEVKCNICIRELEQLKRIVLTQY